MIHHKYLISGYIHIKADTIHVAIERKNIVQFILNYQKIGPHRLVLYKEVLS